MDTPLLVRGMSSTSSQPSAVIHKQANNWTHTSLLALLLRRLPLLAAVVLVASPPAAWPHRTLQKDVFLGLGTRFRRTSRTKFSKTAVTLAPVSALVSM